MASLTVRNLDDNVKKRLRKRAAENGRSLEAEVRDILNKTAASRPSKAQTGLDLVKPLMEFTRKYGPVELEFPPRTPIRDLPSFAEDTRPFRRKK
jgi:plasmid stability protein